MNENDIQWLDAKKKKNNRLSHTRAGPGEVVSTAAFHARVRGSFPGLGGLAETEMFIPHSLVKLSIVGSLRERRARISILVSGGQCHLTHLTILRRFF